MCFVDDFVGMGGTLANLRGYIESKGGRVLGAVVLTGKPFSAKLTLEEKTLEELRQTHGQDLDHWWQDRFGHAFDSLTQSEARYLSRSPDANTIRDRCCGRASGRSRLEGRREPPRLGGADRVSARRTRRLPRPRPIVQGARLAESAEQGRKRWAVLTLARAQSLVLRQQSTWASLARLKAWRARFRGLSARFGSFAGKAKKPGERGIRPCRRSSAPPDRPSRPTTSRP